ncbi:hypothetical protein M1349_03970 [Patescibacteria group bacterium]|nr:hypothetical protein [Patescibacteria group bacterium]
MTEKVTSLRKVQTYVSIFDELDPNKISDYETYHGTGGDVIKDLKVALPIVVRDFQKGLHTPDLPIHVPIYRSYELMKMSVAQKIYIDRRKKLDQIKSAMDAVRLSTDVAVACFSRDKSALKKVEHFEAFIKNSSLEKMLLRRVDEDPDIGIMPEHPGEEDAKLASELKKKTGKADILAIMLGNRGLRRGLNVFLDYRAQTNTPNSEPWPIRYSPSHGDRVPNLAVAEITHLQKMTRGKYIVVIGPQDRIDFAQHYFREIGLRANGDPKTKVIPVPLGIHSN